MNVRTTSGEQFLMRKDNIPPKDRMLLIIFGEIPLAKSPPGGV
jgi:hypothetical protein